MALPRTTRTTLRSWPRSDCRMSKLGWSGLGSSQNQVASIRPRSTCIRTSWRSARRAGLSTVATLHHGTLPGWFSEDTRGYLDAKEREYTWASHVERCAERYDGLVDVWVPIDDPVGWAIRGFLLGSRPPGIRDPEQAAKAVEGALLANHAAWSVLRSGTTPVMAVFGVPTVFAHGPDSETQARQLA